MNTTAARPIALVAAAAMTLGIGACSQSDTDETDSASAPASAPVESSATSSSPTLPPKLGEEPGVSTELTISLGGEDLRPLGFDKAYCGDDGGGVGFSLFQDAKAPGADEYTVTGSIVGDAVASFGIMNYTSGVSHLYDGADSDFGGHIDLTVDGDQYELRGELRELDENDPAGLAGDPVFTPFEVTFTCNMDE